MQILLGVPLNGQTCVWESHGCALLLWGPFIWTFSFSACISVREYIEYPVYRVDNGGLRSRERGTRRVRPDICIQDKFGEKESNMSYDPAHRKCLIGIKIWMATALYL